MPKRIRGLLLKELSLVDEPANKSARVTIFKRDVGKSEDDNMPDANKADATEALAELEKQLTEKFEKQLGELTSKLEKAESERAQFERLSTLTAEQREYHDRLPEADRSAFLAKSDSDRVSVVKRAAEADEVLETDAGRVRKSDIGEAQFSILKSMHQREQAAREDIRKLREESDRLRLEKRVSEEFAHVAGTVDERVAVLKSLESLDETARGALERVLKSAESLAKGAFDKVGARGETVRKARGDFNTCVATIRKRDNCSEHEAMSKARREFPEEFEAAFGSTN